MESREAQQLHERAKRGDPEAYWLLMSPHLRRVANLLIYRLRNAEDRDDALQDTLLLGWRRISTLRDADRVGAWLLRIAANVCTTLARASQRNGLAVADEELGELMCKYGRTSPDSYTTQSLVRDAVGRLGPDAREAAELFYLQGLRIREISQATGRPTGTVKRLLHTARGQLREQWHDGDTQEERDEEERDA